MNNKKNYEIKSDLETDRIVTFSDVLRYKLRKKREGVSDWFGSYNGIYQRHTTMENYGTAQDFELRHDIINQDGKDALLAKTTDKLTGEVTKYGYDDEKLIAAVTYDKSDTVLKIDEFVYDIAGRLTKTRFEHNPLTGEYVTSEMGYLKEADDPLADNRVNCYSYQVNGTEKAKTENTYDAYKRIKNKKYTVDGKVFTKGIEYDKTRVKKEVDSAGGTTSYEYDSMGRISIEKDSNNSILKSYVYDSYGQLIRENNKILDKTFVCEYNNIGNIVTVRTYNYTTGLPGTEIFQQNFSYDSTHPDRLSKWGTESISYNGMGSPTTYNGYNVSWTRGKLSGFRKGLPVKGIENYYFSYNAFGQRTNRSYTYSLPTVEPFQVALGMLMGYSQEFCYDQAGRLICERKTKEYYQTPSDSDKIVYLYDADSIIGMVYTENGKTDTYYFQRNVFGDVVGIYDVNGTKVGGYAYDAWGNCTITQSTKSVVTRNPIRYRGYYYDQDTKLYYLNTRYYSPEWRRFISPDDTAYLDSETPNGLNLYAYCYNDPVTYVDGFGCSPWWSWLISGLEIVGGIALIFTGVGTAVGAGLVAVGAGSLINGAINEHNGGDFTAGWVGGQVAGLLSLIPVIGPTLGAFAGSATSDYMEKGWNGIDWEKAGWSALFGFMLGGPYIDLGAGVLLGLLQAKNSILIGIINSIINIFWRKNKRENRKIKPNGFLV